MATTVKEGAHVKERRPSSPSVVPGNNTDVPRGRRTPKSSSIEGSPDRDGPAALPGKSVPNYLKPTLSSCRDGCKNGRKLPPSETTATKRPITSRRNNDKPPSAQPPLKTPTAAVLSKEKAFKSSYSLPKNAASQDKPTSKTHKPGQARSLLARAKSFPKREGNVKREESGGSATCCGAVSDPDTREKSIAKLEPEEKDHPATTDSSPDNEKVEDKEQNIPIAQHVQDQTSVDLLMVSDKLQETSDSTPQIEEHELNPTPQESEFSKDETGSDEEKEGTEENKEDYYPSEEGQAGEVPQEPSGEQRNGEGSTEKTTPHSETHKPEENSFDEISAPRELKFQRGREINTDEIAGAENQTKENVVLKRQGVQGKKESLAYNDVIEETASKLAEKRKSKVKALVGAFETVISLQEPEGPNQPEPVPGGAGDPCEVVTPDVHNTTTETTNDAD